MEILNFETDILSSYLGFTKTFFKLLTGNDFRISTPDGRESHHLILARELTNFFHGKTNRLIIAIPPRYGKTMMLTFFMAWAIAIYPDCQFLYISYGHQLATDATAMCRDIIMLPHYRKLFGVEIDPDFCAKDDFKTTAGGRVCAAGSSGTITGKDGGVQGATRFSGAILMDDMHKPDEALSDTIREGVKYNYHATIKSRGNLGERTPQIYMGQRVHEDDLGAELLALPEWDRIVLPGIDRSGNALDPYLHTSQQLLTIKERQPYVFSAQFQQDPMPAGGAVFKKDWFFLCDNEPEMLATFITCDTAETNKDYNDKTVFSFWGIYKIQQGYVETNIMGLHWIDCIELSVEPKDLENEFMSFYAGCMRHKVKPSDIAIEKKSTGVTLSSVLKGVQGLKIIDINRTASSGSKATRYSEMQPYVSTKRISLPRNGRHTTMCIEHMAKITLNNSHRFDDVADTAYDAVKMALIDETIAKKSFNDNAGRSSQMVRTLNQNFKKTLQLRENRVW